MAGVPETTVRRSASPIWRTSSTAASKFLIVPIRTPSEDQSSTSKHPETLATSIPTCLYHARTKARNQVRNNPDLHSRFAVWLPWKSEMQLFDFDLDLFFPLPLGNRIISPVSLALVMVYNLVS
jgi:hypothetical protein